MLSPFKYWRVTEDKTRKIQLKKVKLEARLWKLISAHSLVVASYEIDPMLEEKYQVLKQNMCNDIATCEMMLEPVTSPISESSDKIGEVKKFLNPEIIQVMDPTEKEFRERSLTMNVTIPI